MSNINWKYEKFVFQVSAFLLFLFLIISIIFTIINLKNWPLITGLSFTTIFSVLNYFLLIYLTAFCLKKVVSSYKKLIFLLFFGRILLYCLPILTVILLLDYFNLFSALLGLIIPCLATFVVNIFNIFKRSF